MFYKIKKKIYTLVTHRTCDDVSKNIIRELTSRPKIMFGAASITKPVPSVMMRAAVNITSKRTKGAGLYELDCKFICRSGASRNCTNRV